MRNNRQTGIDNMRRNQIHLMNEFNLSVEQFEEIINLLGKRYGKPDMRPELVRKDITKGYIKDNIEIVSKEIADIIDKVRMCSTPLTKMEMN